MKQPATCALLMLVASGASAASVSGESCGILPAYATAVDLLRTADTSYSMPDTQEDVGDFMQSFLGQFKLTSSLVLPRIGLIESSGCSTCTDTVGANLSAGGLSYLMTLHESASSTAITNMSGPAVNVNTPMPCIFGGIDLASQLLSSMQTDNAMALVPCLMDGEQSILGDDADASDTAERIRGDGVDVWWEYPQPLPLLGASHLFLPMLCIIVAMLRLRGAQPAAQGPRAPRVPRLSLLLLFLLCLSMHGTRGDCSSDPTCPLYSSDGTSTCWAKGFGNQMWSFGAGERVFFPGVGLYSISKISTDVNNCCFNIDVQIFACHATRGGVPVRAHALHAPCMRPACATPCMRATPDAMQGGRHTCHAV